ncbi:MAG: four helix bundle protein [Candidatus Hydrogenedentes bacterium]|nr:four helix bundle protein [Candidatus Hydrogenedentota bacterium]
MGKAVQQFEELRVYQGARELVNDVYAATRTQVFSRDFGPVDQIRRAAVSVMANIAEGYERGTKPEFVQFLYIAKGSCGEVRALLDVAVDQKYVSKSDHQSLREKARILSAMISRFIAHVQASTYQGEKQTRANRQAYDAQQKRIAGLKAAQATSINAANSRVKST